MENSAHTLDMEISASGARRSGRAARRLVFWLLCVQLAFAILAFGSTPEWATMVLQLGSAGLLLLWITTQVAARELRVPETPLLWPMLAMALLVTIQLALGTTVYANATRLEAMRWLAYGAVFLVGSSAVSRESSTRRFLLAVTVFGAALSLFAIVQSLTAGGRIYWRVPVTTVAQPFGPFVNHSHYAGLMEMLTPFPLVLCFDSFLERGKRLLAGFAGLMMAASVVFCRSRGGIVALACELAFLGGYLLLSRRRSRALGWQAGILAAGLVAIIVWIGPADLLEHMATLKAPLNPEISGDRLTIAHDSLRMWRDRPLLGFGLDAFPLAYPKYRSFATDYFINEAHNDYVQLLVETGAIGFAIMLGFIFLLYRKGFQNLAEARSPFRSDAILAALAGCTGLLVHSLSDFNLHIPANAAIFYLLCGLATVTPVTQGGWPRHFDHGERHRGRVLEHEAYQEASPLLIEGYREQD